jgi:hypothetical protein
VLFNLDREPLSETQTQIIDKDLGLGLEFDLLGFAAPQADLLS